MIRMDGLASVTLLQRTLRSPIGRLTLLERDGVLCGIAFEGRRDALESWTRRRFGPSVTVREVEAEGPLVVSLERYFAGELETLDGVAIDPGGSAFQRSVWEVLRTIRPGQVRSYGEVAHALGRPDAVRAVARANATNPIPLVVPCHRVIGADGSLTGFGGGLERKRWLLRHESAHAEFRLS
jgi:methylated-DNA-[protein]-cysteine S-methyltransferase